MRRYSLVLLSVGERVGSLQIGGFSYSVFLFLKIGALFSG